MGILKSTKSYKINRQPFAKRLLSIVSETPSFLKMLGVLITPEIRVVVQRNWRTALIPLRHNYLSLGLSRITRIALMTHHYNYIRHNLDRDSLNQIFQKMMVLWEETGNNFSCRIILSIFPSVKEHTEGNLSLVFKVNITDIFILSFTICSGIPFGLSGDVMYIGRLQGVRDRMDLIRTSAKSCNGIAPQTILLSVAEGICLALGIPSIVCPGSRSQLSVARHDELPDEVTIYDQFWLDNGAKKLGEEMFYLPVPIPHKPVKMIKRSHRSRAASRRKYRQSVAEHAKTTFTELFLKCNR